MTDDRFGAERGSEEGSTDVKRRVWKPFRGLEIELTEEPREEATFGQEIDSTDADAAVSHPWRGLLFLLALALVVFRFVSVPDTWFWSIAALAAACLVIYWVLRRRDHERIDVRGAAG